MNVFTNGCFDILHVAHVRYLAAARQKGDWLTVGLNSDQSFRELKKREPAFPAEERREILYALRSVDEVIIFDEVSVLPLIQKLRPMILVKGGDYELNDVVGREFVQSYGGTVEVIGTGSARSSLAVREQQEGVSG